MKYKLVIDKKAEEEVIAIVHEPSTLTKQIEDNNGHNAQEYERHCSA